MKIAKQYLGMLCVLALSMFVSLGAQDEAGNKQQAYGQALYERTCDIVDDNDAQKSAGNVVQKIVTDESIYEFLNLGKQEGYTLDELLESAKKVAQENEDQEVAQILEDVQEEMSKSWFSKHPIMLAAIAASSIAAYVKWDFVQQLFFSCLEKFSLKDKSDQQTEAEKKAAEEEAEREKLAAEQEAQRVENEKLAAKKSADEKKAVEEEAQRVESERLAAEQKTETERLAKEEKQREEEVERKRLAAEQEAQRVENERLAAEQETQRVESERLAAEQEAQRIIAQEQKEKEIDKENSDSDTGTNSTEDAGVSSGNTTRTNSNDSTDSEEGDPQTNAVKLALEKLESNSDDLPANTEQVVDNAQKQNQDENLKENSDDVPDFLLNSVGQEINNTQNLANLNTEQVVDNTQKQNQGENLKDSFDDLPELIAKDDNEEVVHNDGLMDFF